MKAQQRPVLKREAAEQNADWTWTCGCGKTHQATDLFCRWCYDPNPSGSDDSGSEG